MVPPFSFFVQNERHHFFRQTDAQFLIEVLLDALRDNIVRLLHRLLTLLTKVELFDGVIFGHMLEEEVRIGTHEGYVLKIALHSSQSLHEGHQG